MSGGRYSARLDRLARDLRDGLAAGGCRVCVAWGWVRNAEDPTDPWGTFDGLCPVCGRAPIQVFCPDEETFERIAATYAGRPLSFIIGRGLYDAL